MHWEPLDTGFIRQQSPVARGTDLAISPRLVVLPNGEIICSLMFTSRTATNDFVPALTRSTDHGRTWTEPQIVWPQLSSQWSIFTSISRDRYSGRLFLYGTRTEIEVPGESFWSPATSGLKANSLVWATSDDNGRSWNEPAVIPMPIPGSAEAPGPICVTRQGRWLACYSPGNTFDPNLSVDHSQVIVLYSDDQGRSWQHRTMLRFADPESSGAEAWIIELADGRLIGTSWQVAANGGEWPNAFALSADGGETWSRTASTGTLGQTTALAPLPDGRALFLYNQRLHGDPGVRLAVVRPTAQSFGIEHDDYVWRAETRTQSDSSGTLSEWSDFSFGEPSLAQLADGTWLLAVWCIQPSGSGIRYVKLHLSLSAGD